MKEIKIYIVLGFVILLGFLTISKSNLNYVLERITLGRVQRCSKVNPASACFENIIPELRLFFRDNKKLSNLNNLGGICDSKNNFSGLDRNSCYHAFGRLLAYASKDITSDFRNACNELTSSQNFPDLTKNCLDGAFDQVFLDFIVKPGFYSKNDSIRQTNIKNYCLSQNGTTRYSCWDQSWPFYFSNPGHISENDLINFCTSIDLPGQEECFNDMFFVIPGQLNFDNNSMANFCQKFGERRGQCFAIFASRLAGLNQNNIQNAINLCLNAGSSPDEEECFVELGDFIHFANPTQSIDIMKMCSFFPEKMKRHCITPE